MSYPGGKEGAGVWQRIVNAMPPHEVYVEMFAGGAAVLRHKQPADVEFAFELDPEQFEKLRAWASEAGRCVAVSNSNCMAWLRDRVEAQALDSGTLIYADPPYPLSTRRTDRIRYFNELTDEDHIALLEDLRRAARLGARVMLSGYRCALYDERLEDWHRIDYEAMTRGGVRVPESLWINFPPPLELQHGYAVVGENFRERERIKRKRRRWLANFSALAPLEREAIFHDLSNYQQRRKT